MPFQKVGSPQPLNVMPEICQSCGKNKAEFNINGQFVCSECKNKLETPSEETEIEEKTEEKE